MWKVNKVTEKPVIISTTGVIPSTTIKVIETVKLRQFIFKLQKSVILDTCHIVRKLLGEELW
ncbi:MAG: hypothetical protein ACTS8Y_03705 [Arsenophonus sp. ER-EMS1-MAG3]